MAINSLGDFIAQRLEQNKSHKFQRTIKYAAFGGLISAPLVYYWYQFLEFVFKGKGDGPAVILGKLFLDQVVFTPIFFIVYYVYNGLIDGTISEVPEKLSKDLIRVSIDSAKVWTIAQFINFKFVPPNLRVLFGNIVALGWNTYFLVQESKNKKTVTTKTTPKTNIKPKQTKSDEDK